MKKRYLGFNGKPLPFTRKIKQKRYEEIVKLSYFYGLQKQVHTRIIPKKITTNPKLHTNGFALEHLVV